MTPSHTPETAPWAYQGRAMAVLLVVLLGVMVMSVRTVERQQNDTLHPLYVQTARAATLVRDHRGPLATVADSLRAAALPGRLETEAQGAGLVLTVRPQGTDQWAGCRTTVTPGGPVGDVECWTLTQLFTVPPSGPVRSRARHRTELSPTELAEVERQDRESSDDLVWLY